MFSLMRVLARTLALVVVMLPLTARAEAPLRLYVDADFTHAPDVGNAIALGLRAALHEVGNQLAGHDVEVVPHDHRSSPKRSFATLTSCSSL